MRFSLSTSPFRNIHKYHEDDVLHYLDGHLREYAWQHREQHKTSIPPSAFIFGAETASYVFGFAHPTPAAFLAQVKYEASFLRAARVVLFAEANALAVPSQTAFLLVEVQSPALTLRCAYDLHSPDRFLVGKDWAFTSPDSEDPPIKILGITEFFQPIFANPSDSGSL